MFKFHPITSYLKYSFFSALLYNIPAGIFIYDYSYTQSYFLFIGNLLFGIGIAIFIWLLNNKNSNSKSAGYLIAAGHITALAGILFAAVVIFVLLLIMAPELFHAAAPGTEHIRHSPAQLMGNRSIITIMLFSVVAGNIIAGSFISILFSFTIKIFKQKAN